MKTGASRGARAVILGGGVITGVLAPFLVSTTALAWPDAVLISVLLVLVPTLAVGQLPVADEREVRRIPAYAASAVTIGFLAALCWLVGTRSGGAAALGLVGIPARTLVLWSLLLAGAAIGIELLFRQLGIAMGWSESPWLKLLLPRTTRERWAFAALSLVAGFGEELVYRGYAILVLAGLVGTTGAAMLTSVVFGVLHSYQGSVGVVRSAVLGGILAWGFLATGSLWPSVAAHALIDVVGGIILADRLMVPEAAGGVLVEEE